MQSLCDANISIKLKERQLSKKDNNIAVTVFIVFVECSPWRKGMHKHAFISYKLESKYHHIHPKNVVAYIKSL